MKLGIDFRFYRPEPYGLAMHIAGLWKELIPLLNKSEVFTEVIIYLDHKVSLLDVKRIEQDLPGYTEFKKATSSKEKINIVYSKSKYYTFSEQTDFLRLINGSKLDLMFFFTSNYPIFYTRSYVYQILDFTHAKAASKKGYIFKLKEFIQRQVINIGLKNATSIFVLGSQTRDEVKVFTKYNLTDTTVTNYKPSVMLWNGIKDQYRTQAQVNKNRAKHLQGLTKYDSFESKKADQLLSKKCITKPFIIFVSAWKAHKNLTRLISSFINFNKNKYQLVICGIPDKNNLKEVTKLQQTAEVKQGDVIFLERIATEELIYLMDRAQFLIHPSLSEGFGLSLVEAASRGLALVCSDIQIFRDVTAGHALFFNPKDTSSMTSAMQKFTDLPESKKLYLAKLSLDNSKQYTWESTARTIYDSLSLAVQNQIK